MTDDQKYREKVHKAAAEIDSTHPRRIWIEGDGRVYRDGPGVANREEMTPLDMIRLIHTAKISAERILTA